jgi:hypothetical protein
VNKFAVICCLISLCLTFAGKAQDIGSLKLNPHSKLLDSLQSRSQVQFSTDSLKILSWSDSLKSKITSKFSTDSLNYQGKIDSLKNLRLPTEKYTQKLDSIRQKKTTLLAEVQSKKDALYSKTKGKLDDWRSKIQQKLGGKELPGEIPGTDLAGKIPGADLAGKIPGADMPNMPTLNTQGLPTDVLSTDALGNNLQLPDVAQMPALETPELKNIDLSPDLSSLNKKVSFDGLDKLGGLQDKAGKATEGISALKNISTNPDGAIEAGLNNIDQVDGLKDQLKGVEAIKDNEFMETAEKLKDPEAIKEEVKQVVVQKAINHFAGKEEVLQKAMNQMAKYKQKYESLNSLSDIKKRPPNAMKGKPFIERIVPGIGMQILKNEDLLLDVNPYFGYRVSGRLTSGLGWNQRIGYSLDNYYFTSAAVIYGPRIYVEVKTWRGFIVRAEGELMNTVVPASILRRQSDTHQREWVRTAFVGVKKEYRFMKYIKGTAFMMFSVYNDHRKSPYGDVINSRFGFEFPLRKKVKQQPNN